MFTYLFGYMIVHYGVLRKAERAQAAGDTETVRRLVEQHIPHWSRGILNVTGVRLSVEGLDNIPKEGPCVFVANHRSYYDIPLLLASLDKPYGILAKEELEKIPLLSRWMKLLGCVFVQRDDVRASVRALNEDVYKRQQWMRPAGADGEGKPPEVIRPPAPPRRSRPHGPAPRRSPPRRRGRCPGR